MRREGAIRPADVALLIRLNDDMKDRVSIWIYKIFDLELASGYYP